jgi:predicted nuclease of predicted toxin-antitoxin system
VKFLLDAQLPPRLAKALARAGHEAKHVYDCGFLTAKDSDIWKFAVKEDAAIVTKDSDFAAMRMHAPSGPAVVWLRLGNVSNDELIKSLLSALPEIVEAIEAGEGVVEVRR